MSTPSLPSDWMIYLTLMEHSATLQNNTSLILTYLKTHFVLVHIIKVMLWQLCRKWFHKYIDDIKDFCCFVSFSSCNTATLLEINYLQLNMYKKCKKNRYCHQVETCPSPEKSLRPCVTGTEVRDRSEQNKMEIKSSNMSNCVGYAGDYWCFDNLYLVYQWRCTAELRLETAESWICFLDWNKNSPTCSPSPVKGCSQKSWVAAKFDSAGPRVHVNGVFSSCIHLL